MPDFGSDGYTKDMIMSLRGLALRASDVEDYDLAQQLYAVMFDLQLRLERTTDRVGDLLNAPYTRNTGPSERLRLVPMMRDVRFRRDALTGAPASVCLRCGTSASVIGPSGLCGMCEVGIGPRRSDNGDHE